MSENILTKEYGGIPVWGYGAGILAGLWLFSKIGGTSSTLPNLPDLGTGSTDTSVPCTGYSVPTCPGGQHVEWHLDSNGCIQPVCVDNTGGSPLPGPTPPPVPTGGNPTCYSVVSGDSLSKIASKFGTPGGYHTLVTWNSVPNSCSPGYPQLLVNPNLIFAGWKLRVL